MHGPLVSKAYSNFPNFRAWVELPIAVGNVGTKTISCSPVYVAPEPALKRGSEQRITGRCIGEQGQ